MFPLFTFHVLVAHGDLGAQVKILLLASILICRAETSGIINKITVLLFSIVFFPICDIPGSTFDG